MARALSLFRRIARAARALPSARERRDAMNEARDAFRAAAGATGGEAEAKLLEAEQRLDIAKHYGIAYARLEHQALSGGGNKDVEPPSHAGAAVRSEALAATMRSQFPVNPASAALRAAARARRAAVARSEVGVRDAV